jgi:hypothetical protein
MERSEDFDLFLGLILIKLYEVRGTRPTLSPEDFGLLDDERKSGSGAWLTEPGDPTGQRWDTWANAFKWLHEEGYVRGKDMGPGNYGEPCFADAELTESGFRILNSVPRALAARGGGESLGKQLINAARGIGRKSAEQWAQRGVDEAARHFIEIVRGCSVEPTIVRRRCARCCRSCAAGCCA